MMLIVFFYIKQSLKKLKGKDGYALLYENDVCLRMCVIVCMSCGRKREQDIAKETERGHFSNLSQ